jgi:glycosyltransferase involved in cell wall biosynthesis
MKTQPDISLIAIAYNLEDYIEECLNSLVNQTHKSIEIIVVDDGSTDSTLSKIQTIAQTDRRIKVLSQKNQGSNSARENGFKIAKGNYVQFIDGDDWLDLNTCKHLYKKVQEQEENVDVILFHSQKVYPDGMEIACTGFTQKKTYSHPFKEYSTGVFTTSIGTKFIRRKFLTEHASCFLKNVTYGEDLIYSALFFLYNPKVAFVDEFLYYYRQRKDSLQYNIQGYSEDCEKIFSALQVGFDNIKPCQELQDYRQFFTLKHLIYIYARALQSNNKKIAAKIATKILKKKFTVPSHIPQPSLIYWLGFKLYNISPNLLLFMYKIYRVIKAVLIPSKTINKQYIK